MYARWPIDRKQLESTSYVPLQDYAERRNGSAKQDDGEKLIPAMSPSVISTRGALFLPPSKVLCISLDSFGVWLHNLEKNRIMLGLHTFNNEFGFI